MKRIIFFAYGMACYLLFLVTAVYMAGFVGNFLVPKSIDSGPTGSVAAAIGINLLLVGLFAAQHSIMARPGFKGIWTRLVPKPIERSTYVLLTCVVTFVLMWQWRPLPATVWEVQSPLIRTAMWVLFAAGWLSIPLVSLLINHFDLFGVRQVWLYLTGRPYTSLEFRTPSVYKHVRHPLYIGWAVAFWVTPTMSVGHLLFAAMLTVYMVLAVFVEERDLVRHFGEQYEDYRRRVPKYIPRLKSAWISAPKLIESQAVKIAKPSEANHV